MDECGVFLREGRRERSKIGRKGRDKPEAQRIQSICQWIESNVKLDFCVGNSTKCTKDEGGRR